MKKKMLIIVTALCFLFAFSAASHAFNSTNFYFDLNSVDNTYFTVDDGVTELISQLLYYAETESTITPGGSVTDVGRAYITGLNLVSGNDPGDTEGFRNSSLPNWGIAMLWDDLTGQVTSIAADGTITADYYSGTIEMYVDFDPYAVNLGNDATLTDGQLVATWDVTSGGYVLKPEGEAGSSYILNANAASILDNFWYAEGGIDLNDFVPFDLVLGYTAGDNDPDAITRFTDADGNLIVLSNHDSSFSIGVVPEPGTLMLLGLGMLGIAGASRRKFLNS